MAGCPTVDGRPPLFKDEKSYSYCSVWLGEGGRPGEARRPRLLVACLGFEVSPDEEALLPAPR